jgi:hypothetical protein
VIEGLNSATKYIYHYTSMDTAKIILKSRRLKFGSYMKTNDPKETKHWEFDLGTNEHTDLGKYDMEALGVWLSKELKANTKVACFSLDTEPLTGDHTADIFNRGFCKPRMWVQYAANHTGVCLVFDFQTLDALVREQFSSGLIFGGPVQYVNRSIVTNWEDIAYTINVDYLSRMGPKAYVKWHRQWFFKRLFFEKMTDWKDEREFRWIVCGFESGDLFVELKNALVGIVFGENSEEAEVDAVMEMTSGMGFRRTRLKWKNCSPWYDFGNLKYIGFKPNQG